MRPNLMMGLTAGLGLTAGMAAAQDQAACEALHNTAIDSGFVTSARVMPAKDASPAYC